MKSLTINECGFVAHYYPAAGSKSHAMIVLGGSEGDIPHATDLFTNFHALGFSVLYTAYFGADTLPPSIESIPLEYFESVFNWLYKQPEIISDEYAVFGTSKGGELALLLGSRYKQIKCIIAAVPSHVIWQGIPKGLAKPPYRSSWSYSQSDLPFVQLPLSLSLIWGILTNHFRKFIV